MIFYSSWLFLLGSRTVSANFLTFSYIFLTTHPSYHHCFVPCTYWKFRSQPCLGRSVCRQQAILPHPRKLWTFYRDHDLRTCLYPWIENCLCSLVSLTNDRITKVLLDGMHHYIPFHHACGRMSSPKWFPNHCYDAVCKKNYLFSIYQADRHLLTTRYFARHAISAVI